jgi:hypothetical protein
MIKLKIYIFGLEAPLDGCPPGFASNVISGMSLVLPLYHPSQILVLITHSAQSLTRKYRGDIVDSGIVLLLRYM